MIAVLVKDGCAFTTEGKDNKPEDMTDVEFEKKNEPAKADILLVFDELVVFNVFEETTENILWDKLK